MQAISRATFLALGIIAAGLSAAPVVQAQEAFKVDAGLADQGAKVWKSKSCDGCHTIGKGKRAGPDLAGVTSRRSGEWLAQWLKNPPAMAKSDDAAQAMVKESQGVVMPDFHLRDPEIQGLIHYLAREGGAK